MEQELIIENYLRGMAGTVVTFSVLMSQFHSPNWIWLTLFAGLNLFQSFFTGTCPAKFFLRKLSVGQPKELCGSSQN